MALTTDLPTAASAPRAGMNRIKTLICAEALSSFLSLLQPGTVLEQTFGRREAICDMGVALSGTAALIPRRCRIGQACALAVSRPRPVF
jgi:hypothetical protein